VIRSAYRIAAAACAGLVWRVPALEQTFLRFGMWAWARPGVGRFYRSAAHRLAERMRDGRSPFRAVTVQGIPLLLDVTEFTAGPLYFGGSIYEPKTTAYFAEVLGPGRVFVDIGANHGYFSVLAAALVGEGGRVVAFEPNPRIFRQLRTHVGLNGFDDRVTLLPSALADAPGEARLFVSQDVGNSGLSSLTPASEHLASGSLSEAHTVSVPVDTFDRWFASSGLSRVDLMKIDVEGAEALVLQGMSAALRDDAIGAIICETAWDGPAHRALCEAGFAARMLDSAGLLSNVLYTGTEARRS
jgi:FkbM family methyltransferase